MELNGRRLSKEQEMNEIFEGLHLLYNILIDKEIGRYDLVYIIF